MRGSVELRTTFTDGATARTEKIKYLVVNAPFAYNILLGRPTLNRLGAVPSTRHMKLKIPSMEGVVITIKSDQKEARRCYENSLKQQRGVCHVTTTPPQVSDEGRAEVATLVRGTSDGEEMEEAGLGGTGSAQDEADGAREVAPRESGNARAVIASERRPHPTEGWVETEIRGKGFKLGGPLDEGTRRQISRVMEKNLGAFAWSTSDMPGIDPDFLCHRLAMDPQVWPVRQRRRKFNEEKRQVIHDETHKLLAAGHIREIQHPEWLANVVLVKKSNGKWRMWVDFTDLNKASPKDSYPLPSIDALVDSASGCQLMSFLDAFSGYNQIRMYPMDECKTAFMTERSCYCYKVMSFGLKNAGATYQRLMDRVLSPMLGRNEQAYVDDMVVTSRGKEQHVADLEELFTTIAKYGLKLNPEKCIFGVEAGKFLGFLLTKRGIEANPEKCVAIMAMRSPASVKRCNNSPASWRHCRDSCPLEGKKAILTSSVSSGTAGSFGPRSVRRRSLS